MSDVNSNDPIPSGFALRSILKGHAKGINRIAWSPDGSTISSPSNDGTVRLWNVQTGKVYEMLEEGLVFDTVWSPDGYNVALGGTRGIVIWNTQTREKRKIQSGQVNSLAWSPDGQIIAFSSNTIIQLLNIETGQYSRAVMYHSDEVSSLVWSPDGSILASGATDCTIQLWNKTGQLLHRLIGHSKMVHSVSWSPDGKLIASGSSDATIRLWHSRTGRQLSILEGHTGSIVCVIFSPGGHLLVSKSHDGTVRCWRTDTLEMVAVLSERLSRGWNAGLAFHPKRSTLATLSEEDKAIRIWDLNPAVLLGNALTALSIHYTNAKIILVGDTGVGKSALGLVLTGKKFEPTESTHGRSVWVFDSQEAELNEGRKETRETLLWDLAGQPGYRLTHQLHLHDVAVALVVFDARSETDPFAGVHYWVRALLQVQRIQGNSAPPMKMFLVAARTDRGGRSVSLDRIENLMHELRFDRYFEISAKEGKNIDVLAEKIRGAIDWDALPKVSSTDLFRRIKAFLTAEKETGQRLSKEDDLYRLFQASSDALTRVKDLRAQFKTCIGRVESRGLIRRLNFGDLILLQPEMLDTYTSALVNAVKDEPDGLGCIAEEKAKAGDFPLPSDNRLSNQEQEKLLLIAMVDNLLRYEIALREITDDGAQLVFPSQSTRENPKLFDLETQEVIFHFDGPVPNIYAMLAVRLSHSGIFKKQELWKNAVTYTTKSGGIYGLCLKHTGEGHGTLALFFDDATSEEMCFHFEEYVHAHLRRRALPESIQRQRIFICAQCKTSFNNLQVTRRRERGYNWIMCSVCESRVMLFDKEERLVASHRSLVLEMDETANIQRNRVATTFIRDSLSSTGYVSEGPRIDLTTPLLKAKMKNQDFDVFLCYQGLDKPTVKKLGEELKKHGILPWLDEWELQPGRPWQPLLEKQIKRIKSAAVFIGKEGIGPWQQVELDALLREFIKRGCPVIPVLLEDAPEEPQFSMFLAGMTWVDFRKVDPNPMEQLIWGITSKQGPI